MKDQGKITRLLGVADSWRVGSLEPGKDAASVLYDGDPFEYTSHVEAVVVNGEVATRREKKLPTNCPLCGTPRST